MTYTSLMISQEISTVNSASILGTYVDAVLKSRIGVVVQVLDIWSCAESKVHYVITPLLGIWTANV